MGCDIHFHTEIKVNGVWHHYSQPRLNRDYDLFAKLAGVRNYSGLSFTPPRGLPDDVSFTTRLCYEHDGPEPYVHSASWLSGKELAEIVRWDDARQGHNVNLSLEHSRGLGYLFGNGWESYPRSEDSPDFPAEVEDVRCVFWFDN